MRVTFEARLGKIRIPLQVDIGFGDAVTPQAQQEEFPTLLDLPAPILLTYPRETAIAEKFEAIVNLGLTNSRMKDYYDIWLLSQQFDFDGVNLVRAIEATFRRRRTVLPTDYQLVCQSSSFPTPANYRSGTRSFAGVD